MKFCRNTLLFLIFCKIVDAVVKITGDSTARAGGAHILTCSVSPDSPTPNGFTWFIKDRPTALDQGRFTVEMTTESSTLTIAPVEVTDSGKYLCRVTFSGNSSEEANFTLTVKTTPVVQLPMLHEATLGRNTTLTCVASDATFFKWYFSGTQILSKGRFDITGKGNHRSLHIRNVIMTDRGEYTCIAFNIAGSAMNSTQLDVLAIPVLNMLEDYREIEKGSSFNISCQVVQGIPQPSLVWTIGQDQATSIEGVSIATDENMSILMFGNITFAHSNKYTCTATNRVGTNSSEVEIKVRGPPDVIVGPPVMTEVGVGQDVQFSCSVQAFPLLTEGPLWVKDGRVLQQGDKYTLGLNNLTVKSLSREDSGTYSCVASNSAGSTNDSLSLSVIEPPPPPRQLRIEGAVGTRSVTLLWSPPIFTLSNQMVDHYRVVYRKENGSIMATKLIHSQHRNYSFTDLYPGTTYYMWVRAGNVGGDSNQSDVIQVKTVPSVPSVREFNITAQRGGRGILLTWSLEYDGGADIKSVSIDYRIEGSEWVVLNDTVAPHSNTLTVRGLKPLYQYTFRLKLSNIHGTSSLVTGTAMTEKGVPIKPSRPVGVSMATDSVTIKFMFSDIGSGELMGVAINISTVGAGSMISHIAVSGSLKADQDIRVTVPSLQQNTQYTFRVAGVNDIGQGEFSEESDPVITAKEDHLLVLVVSSVSGVVAFSIVLVCLVITVSCCCRANHGNINAKGSSSSDSPIMREPLPARSGVVLTDGSYTQSHKNRMSDVITPFSLDSMPKEPPPYPLPPPLFSRDLADRNAANSSGSQQILCLSQGSGQYDTLLDNKQHHFKMDPSGGGEMEWYLKGISRSDSNVNTSNFRSSDLQDYQNCSTDV